MLYLHRNIDTMKLDYMLQVTKVDNGSDAILMLKEVGINCEVFFNKLQQIKFNLNSNIVVEFIYKAGVDNFFDSKGVLKKGSELDQFRVKIDYYYLAEPTRNKLQGCILL